MLIFKKMKKPFQMNTWKGFSLLKLEYQLEINSF